LDKLPHALTTEPQVQLSINVDIGWLQCISSCKSAAASEIVYRYLWSYATCSTESSVPAFTSTTGCLNQMG